MPRQARLDALGALHHVMVRGVERWVIFTNDADREDFVARLAHLAIDVEGYTGRAVADLLGVGTPSVYKAAQRGRATSRQWDELVRHESE